jgi:integrase
VDSTRRCEIAEGESVDLRAGKRQTEGVMTKHQTGYIWRVGKSWYGRWYRNEIVNGAVERVQHSEKLVEYSDRYRSKKDVRPLLDAKLLPVNEGRSSAESTMSVVEYFEKFFLPYADAELKPSTANGYRSLFRMYLKAHLGKVVLRDFTCGKACKVLSDIYQEHKLSTKSLRHCKGLLSTVFSYAKRMDVLTGDNPVKDATWPKGPNGAKAANKTHAYTMDEVIKMLHELTGTAKAAVALMYFCGLRPGEARGAKWCDYDTDKRIIHVQRSMWRKHETLPKTEESVAPVPVAEVLSAILSEMPRSSEFILATPSGKPIDLHNLAARAIVPALERCAVCQEPESNHAKAGHAFKRDPELPEWKGFYALRRGIGTALMDVDSAVAAKSVLRHSNVATTTAHYVKSVDAAAIRGMDKINALFDNGNGSARPN